MADGGNRDEGMLKEKRACRPVARPASESGVDTLGEEVKAEKKVRMMGRKMRQKTTAIKRGGRIVERVLLEYAIEQILLGRGGGRERKEAQEDQRSGPAGFVQEGDVLRTNQTVDEAQQNGHSSRAHGKGEGG